MVGWVYRLVGSSSGRSGERGSYRFIPCPQVLLKQDRIVAEALGLVELDCASLRGESCHGDFDATPTRRVLEELLHEAICDSLTPCCLIHDEFFDHTGAARMEEAGAHGEAQEPHYLAGIIGYQDPATG